LHDCDRTIVAVAGYRFHIGRMQIRINDKYTLRPFRPADRDDLVAGLNDWAVARWLARVPHPYRQDHAEEFLRRDEHGCVDAAIKDPARGFALALCHEDRVAGGLVANPVNDAGEREIGFWLARRLWGQGIMQHAVVLMMAEIMRHAPDTKLIASANQDNHRSQKLIRNLSFVDDGEGKINSTPLQRPVRVHRFRRP
jgi:8-oxo-dGTP diphosphatase